MRGSMVGGGEEPGGVCCCLGQGLTPCGASDCSPVGNSGLSIDEESEEEEEEEEQEEEEDDNDKEEEEEDESEKEEEMKLKKMEEQKAQSNKVRFPAAGWEPQEEAAGALLTVGCPGRVPLLGLLWLCRSCTSHCAAGSWPCVGELWLPHTLRTCRLLQRVLQLFCGPQGMVSVPGEGWWAPSFWGPELSDSPQALPVKVTAGKLRLEDRQRLEQEQQSEEKRLAIMMMKKREKYLYKKIMFGKKRKVREVQV